MVKCIYCDIELRFDEVIDHEFKNHAKELCKEFAETYSRYSSSTTDT